MADDYQADRDLGDSGGLATLAIYPLLGLSTAVAGDLWDNFPGQVIAVLLTTTVFGLVRLYLGQRLRSCHVYQLPNLRNAYAASVLAVAVSWSAYSCLAVLEYGRSWSGLMAMMTTCLLYTSPSPRD